MSRIFWRQLKKILGADRENSARLYEREIEEGKRMREVWQRLERVGKELQTIAIQEAQRSENKP